MKTKQIIVALLLCFSSACVYGQSDPIAVVVNPSNPLTNISMAKLRETFQCERTSWPSGERIALFSRYESTIEYTVMLREIYKMSEAEYKQFWVMKQVRGEGSCRVTGLPSKGMTMEAVRSRPGAIALVRVSDVTPEMKVLSIDGRKPDSPGYALQ
jgi:ABC-type phosphate transport system substrate-binding protein